jgi:hypothetical protein
MSSVKPTAQFIPAGELAYLLFQRRDGLAASIARKDERSRQNYNSMLESSMREFVTIVHVDKCHWVTVVFTLPDKISGADSIAGGFRKSTMVGIIAISSYARSASPAHHGETRTGARHPSISLVTNSATHVTVDSTRPTTPIGYPEVYQRRSWNRA